MILLVEDEAISRYSCAQILRLHGHEVMEAADGVKALTLLDEYVFQLIITDVAMPRLDGFALVTTIREKWPNLPIVLSQVTQPNMQQRLWTDRRRNFFRSLSTHRS
jgi:CheY-like chemotaxis protein